MASPSWQRSLYRSRTSAPRRPVAEVLAERRSAPLVRRKMGGLRSRLRTGRKLGPPNANIHVANGQFVPPVGPMASAVLAYLMVERLAVVSRRWLPVFLD